MTQTHKAKCDVLYRIWQDTSKDKMLCELKAHNLPLAGEINMGYFCMFDISSIVFAVPGNGKEFLKHGRMSEKEFKDILNIPGVCVERITHHPELECSILDKHGKNLQYAKMYEIIISSIRERPRTISKFIVFPDRHIHMLSFAIRSHPKEMYIINATDLENILSHDRSKFPNTSFVVSEVIVR